MLSLMLGWIPVLGPIFQGLSSIATSFFGTKTAAIQADASVTIAETQASQQIIQVTNDDICLRLLRDIYCTPACVHLFLVSWDTIIAETTWVNHDLMWHTATYPASYAWYPTTVAVFLLGNIGLNMWKRK